MPKHPIKVSLESLLESVETSGAALGERATTVSNIIEEIDQRLRDIPGKVAVCVSDEDRDIAVEFQKVRGGWGLRLIENYSDWQFETEKVSQLLTELPAVKKALAVPLLPRLLQEMGDKLREHVSEITTALNSLDKMEDT